MMNTISGIDNHVLSAAHRLRYRDSRHAHVGCLDSGGRDAQPRAPPGEKGLLMALDDEDIISGSAGGEGPADGGSNPDGHDGGADGTAAGGEGPADGGSNPDGHDGGADGTA